MANTTSYRLPTLYPTPVESNRALALGVEILKNNEIKKDELGFSLIEDLCNKIKEKDSSFKYLNRNHIIEFFFKDADKKILISGADHIRYKDIRYLQPPEFLYFGTVEAMIKKMREHGIRSFTKGYLKLYETPEKACEFAKKFARDGEKTVCIKIKAMQAFSEGLKFSTYIDGEYIVVQIQKSYIV